MATPTQQQLGSLSSSGPGFSAESAMERMLTLAAIMASGQNPDGTPSPVIAPVSGWTYATGLVNDAGVTDNTTALANSAANLPSQGGVLVLPSGTYGCNWTPPSGVTLLGQGQGNPSGPGATILCGVISLAGTQIAPIQRTNPNVTLQNLSVDGGPFTSTVLATSNGATLTSLVGGNLNVSSTLGSTATGGQFSIVTSGGTATLSYTSVTANASLNNIAIVSGTGAWTVTSNLAATITFPGSYSCIYGLYDNAADTNHFDIYVTGGTLASWNQDTGCNRPTGNLVRVTNNWGGVNQAMKVQRSFTSLATNSNTTITVNGTTDVFVTALDARGVAGDIGRGIAGPGIPLGAYITAVASTTSATISDAATATASGLAANVYQGEAVWMQGTDNQLVELRSTNGTTRLFGNGGNQIDTLHVTNTSNMAVVSAQPVAPPSVSFEGGQWQFANMYSDSCPVSSVNVVHKNGSKRVKIANCDVFSNSPSATQWLDEQDTVDSLVIGLLSFNGKSGAGSVYGPIVKLEKGNNPGFTAEMISADNNCLVSATSTVTGGTVGPCKMNYAGTMYGDRRLTRTGPFNPASTTSTTLVMAGIGQTFTPSFTGKVYVRFLGTSTTATASVICSVQGQYGTGGAPANGAAVTGTAFTQGTLALKPAIAGSTVPFEISDVITGLTPGTAYWFDLSLSTGNVADAASVASVICYVEEI